MSKGAVGGVRCRSRSVEPAGTGIELIGVAESKGAAQPDAGTLDRGPRLDEALDGTNGHCRSFLTWDEPRSTAARCQYEHSGRRARARPYFTTRRIAPSRPAASLTLPAENTLVVRRCPHRSERMFSLGRGADRDTECTRLVSSVRRVERSGTYLRYYHGSHRGLVRRTTHIAEESP